MKNFFVLLVLLLTAAPAFASDKQADEAFDRVMKTRTLRCAYTLYPSFMEKDPNTGKMSGLFYDLTEELGKQIGLKIEWTDEVGTDMLFESFKSDKADANCTGYTAMPTRTWGGDFTRELFYMPYNMYMRADETRFQKFEDVNKAGVTIATLDGEGSQIIAAERFPLATAHSFPGLTPATDRLEAVVGSKADVTMMEATIAAEYMARNPGKIKLMGADPVQVAGSNIVLPHKEEALKAMLNTGISFMLDSGVAARIIAKHEKYPGSIFLPTKSYQPE